MQVERTETRLAYLIKKQRSGEEKLSNMIESLLQNKWWNHIKKQHLGESAEALTW